MAGKLEAQKIRYQKDLDAVNDEYEKFRTENVKKTSALTFDVYVEEPVSLYIAVSDYIHSAIVLIDICLDISRINGKDRSFLSGVRFIENIVKHEKQNMDITEFLSATPKMIGSGKRNENGLKLNVNMEIDSFWQDMLPMQVAPENERQKNNYEFYVKGKRVMDTVNELDGIIRKYISL